MQEREVNKMEQREFDCALTEKIDDLFWENAKRVAPDRVVQVALEEFDLTEGEINSVISFAELLSLFQMAIPSSPSHAALVGMGAGLLIGKVLSEQTGGGK